MLLLKLGDHPTIVTVKDKKTRKTIVFFTFFLTVVLLSQFVLWLVAYYASDATAQTIFTAIYLANQMLTLSLVLRQTLQGIREHSAQKDFIGSQQ